MLPRSADGRDAGGAMGADAAAPLGRPPSPAGAVAALNRVRAALFSDRAALVLGRYQLRAEIGRGGMGVVYAAFDPRLQREVAIKIVAAEATQAARALCREEARALAHVAHPAICPVFDVGSFGPQDVPRGLLGAAGGGVYIVMERLRGRPLQRWVEAERPGAERLHAVLATVGAGVSAAHRVGLVHCDIKPSNVIVEAGDRARLLDFGLASLTAPAGRRAAAPEQAVGGTLGYMAPERARGDAADPRTDQFALAMTWLRMLLVLRNGPALPSLRSVQAAVDDRSFDLPSAGLRRREAVALRRALAHDPAQRFGDVDALVRALRHRRGRAWWWGAAAAVVVVAAAVQTERADERCEAARVAIREARLLDRADAAVAAIASSEASFAETVAVTTRERLADFETLVRGSWTEACSATPRDEAARDRLLLCVESELTRAGLVLDGLRLEPERHVQGALGTADALVDGFRCADVTPATAPAAALTGWMRAVARAEAHVDLGELESAGRALDEVERVLGPTEAPGLRARVLMIRAAIARGDGDYRDALVLTKDALWSSPREGTQLRRSIYLELAWLAGYRLGDREAGWRFVARAREAWPDAEAHPYAVGVLHNVEGTLWLNAGDPQRAAEAFEASAAALRGKGSSTMLHAVLSNLVVVRQALGQPAQAYRDGHELLGRLRVALGATHPVTRQVATNVAQAALALGELREAEQLAEEGLEDPPAHLDAHSFANAINTLAAIKLERGDASAAVLMFQRAAQVIEATDNPVAAATFQLNVAMAQRRAGQLDAARRELDAARRSLDRLPSDAATLRALVAAEAAQLPGQDAAAQRTALASAFETLQGGDALALAEIAAAAARRDPTDTGRRMWTLLAHSHFLAANRPDRMVRALAPEAE